MLPHVKIWAFFILGVLFAYIFALYNRLDKTKWVLTDTSNKLLDAEYQSKYFQDRYVEEVRRNRKF